MRLTHCALAAREFTVFSSIFFTLALILAGRFRYPHASAGHVSS